MCLQPAIASTTAPGSAPGSGLDAATDTTIALLVAQRVRLGQVAASDRDDLAQFLRLALLERAHRYRAEAGAWATFVRHVLEGEMQRWLRYQLQACRNGRRAHPLHRTGEGGLCPQAAEIPDHRPEAEQGRLELRDDVADLLTRLAPGDRAIAQGLMRFPPTELAHRLGCSRARLYRALERMRPLFAAAGLGG